MKKAIQKIKGWQSTLTTLKKTGILPASIYDAQMSMLKILLEDFEQETTDEENR